ncbi:bifunctional 2-C-methyl-D-erythritol 4-phosphate cytidylyltransferase/2-C-methyl-D-erythritol 2,4-cyclodiphosphate synthase [Sphingomonas bacterium]|uniref:bifunctional 2-C-methyl-D-erythritol 4-phosphate cytidylyltransferase/2-C-methyl-D-erythritol 2,4-cyclodiphosphate synthase n=1 Tax=Sphingomonas bacterium TaxID=1895847 RepID=UPI0026211172|nr:bifunctional 2-C-methyl-D-erythritol 4-phosphate cytidylyltransferase/2-C-methyl-D-erythritol 2,4-cyclodiphosphate synthase [Sphingomonas bacterium]MDB5679253.1 ispDF [Sphingomonas bacterium]MDB5711052.1 bifunctional 2-C-methyl-D-erythritol 4-phosphate cytidylyltransferase/2-C-methyl-D-erythritol [Sphingomonas bacterium]
MSSSDTVALIVAAGKGERAGGDVPKQFQLLHSLPLVEHARRAFAAHPAIDRIVTVIADGQSVEGEAVVGGATRRESVRNGLQAIGAAARVLIHDAARPVVPVPVIDRLLAALDRSTGAVPILPIADTLAAKGEALGDTVDRSTLVRVQTPQAFDFAAILAAHRSWPEGEETTDDAQIMRRAGHEVTMVAGDPMLEKITYPGDLVLAEARLGASMRVRAATGYDVHRLVEGEELWLGGVLIPHDRGLSGHSDADVALHAITDAVLGTIASGDIGTHFPPSDPQWRGAESGQFLQHAASLVAAQGGIIDFVDLTIICEAPKIGPWREPIRARIAALLGLARGQISVKATTTERLGFTGRGEGIAAQAVVTIRV